MPDDALLRVTELRRYYRRGPCEVKAVDGVSLSLPRGRVLAIVGASGSGKSTLLNLLAGLDTPTSGTVEVERRSLYDRPRRELSAFRARKIGMIFQSFNLLPHYSAVQNVEAALYFNGTPPEERKARAVAMLQRLGLGARLDHRPADLSGGEQQRVAIARAIVKNPEILLADEPTGNLDHENARQIAELLAELNRGGLTIVLVTHNLEMAADCAHEVVRLHYGRVVPGGARP